MGAPRRVRALLAKARAASANASRNRVSDTAAVVAMLESAPNRTLAEIYDALTEEYELALSVERLKQVVALLRRQGAIVVATAGRPLRYRTSRPGAWNR